MPFSVALTSLLFEPHVWTAHVGHALQSGWTLPALKPACDADRTLEVDGVWPYWLKRDAATPNTLRWSGVWLVSASSRIRRLGTLAPPAATNVPS